MLDENFCLIVLLSLIFNENDIILRLYVFDIPCVN